MQDAREEARLTQAELATRAGVSRQLVGAVEAGRHLPRVDAAMALAAVLGVDLKSLFPPSQSARDIVTGSAPEDGSLVRVGRVGDRPVTTPVRIGSDGFDVADAVVESGRLASFGHHAPGLVIAGCEPALEVLERLLREDGMGSVAVTASSAASVEALSGGRAHAAVVHGPEGKPYTGAQNRDVDRFHLTRWRVGLAAAPGSGSGWWREALSGRQPVVQREPGAAVQRVFEDAVENEGIATSGPRVGSHLEGARLAVATGMAAVTIEPAALAVGAAFHPLDIHEAQIWVSSEWRGEGLVTKALSVVSDVRFQRRLEAIGGYDLTGIGSNAA